MNHGNLKCPLLNDRFSVFYYTFWYVVKGVIDISLRNNENDYDAIFN